MATLQVRDVDDRLYESLRKLAANEKRSISQEVIHIIETYLANPQDYAYDFTEEFINLSGSWEDDRSAEEIVKDIKSHRTNSRRFRNKNDQLHTENGFDPAQLTQFHLSFSSSKAEGPKSGHSYCEGTELLFYVS